MARDRRTYAEHVRLDDRCYDLRARIPSCSSFGSEEVDFDGRDDVSDPKNWSPTYKWSLLAVVSLISLSINLAILTSAPAIPVILQEFDSTSKLEATLLVSIWELGEAMGPLIFAPLSEVYGRLPVYHAANVIFIILSICAAYSTSIHMLIAVRFLLGLSVVSLTLNACIVGDIFEPEQRGRALSLMGALPYVAPCVGPAVGGLIADGLGWRWTFKLTAVITGILELLLMVTLRETYQVVILERKTKKLRSLLHKPKLRSRHAPNPNVSMALWQSFIRPIRLLMTSKVIFMVSICGAFAMGYLYMTITILGPIFQQVYGFSERHAGLSYLGLGSGMFGGIILAGAFLDWHLERERRKDNISPEVRLPPMILGYTMVPIGLLCFGWLVESRVHSILPIFSTVLIGGGFAGVAISAWSYLVDAFGIYAASATAGAQIFRCAASALLPLAAPGLMDRIGFGLSMTLFATIALVFAPVPVILMKYGKRLRERTLQGPSQV